MSTPFLRLPLLLALAATTAFAASGLNVTLQNSREKNFGASPVIIVPTVYVKLPVSGHIFVAKQGSALSTIGGGNANTVRASARYTVKGLDKALAQQIAAKVYDDFVGRLRDAGYTVKTYADIKDDAVVRSAQREAGDAPLGLPTENDQARTVTWAVASPTDEQAFRGGMVGGVFNQFMSGGRSKLGEGTIVIPTYVITAPQIGGTTRGGYATIHAGISSAPGMNLQFAIVQLLTEKGGWGDSRLKQPVNNITEKAGELKARDTTDKAGNDFSKALSTLTGAGQINTKSTQFTFTIDPAAYTSGVLAGTGAFNAELAKVVAAARK